MAEQRTCRSRRRRALGWMLALMLAPALPAPAAAQTSVDLQLVLAVDTSGSVNQYRFDLQKQGYAAAFRNPRVLKAIRSGIAGAIAVTVFQWTGPEMQVQVIDWTIVHDAASAEAFAAAIEDTPRQLFSGGTSVSGAIDYGASLLANSASRFPGARRVIDVSGDGSNNRGRPAALAPRRRDPRRHHHQRPADPRARAEPRSLLLGQRGRRSRRLHGHGADIRDVRRGGARRS